MPNKKHLGTITILIKNRQMNAPELNRLLGEQGRLIMARLGVNVQRSCVENCTGLITVAVEGTAKEIGDLAKAIDGLYGIVAKSCILTD